MARMYPDRLPEGAPRSEHIVFEALKTLDDDWMIFCSLPLQGVRWNRQGDGEADFVLAHKSRGITVLEVKGGELEVVDGQWFQTSRGGHRKELNQSPAQQAADTKRMLQDYLAGHVSRMGKLRCGHAVCFPAVSVDNDLAPDTPRAIVIDAGDLADPTASVNRVSGHWGRTTTFDDQQFSEVRKALAPTKGLTLKLRDRANQIIEKQIELTDGQAWILHFIRSQRRATITGGAGTGKTVLAVERARQLAADGLDVALLCFNAPLGDHIAAQVQNEPRITAGHFHRVARDIVARAHLLPDQDFDQGFWNETLPGLLPDAAESIGHMFDAIIVDEGQDFHPNWFTALQLILGDADNGIMYVFADSQQDLYRTGWEPPFEGAPYQLDRNCRNTVQIARRVSGVFGVDEVTLGAEGPEPTFTEIRTPAQLPKELGKIVRRLLDENFSPNDVVILTRSRAQADRLRDQQIGDVRLVETGKSGIVVETVQRFKGLESDVVVLLLDEIENDADRSLAYVGMSRARVVLHVLGPTSAKGAIDW